MIKLFLKSTISSQVIEEIPWSVLHKMTIFSSFIPHAPGYKLLIVKDLSSAY